MLFLKKIVIQDFKNIKFQEISFSSNVNCISGNNGEGKTNLMDAIHYLSMTKSSFGSSDNFNYRRGTNQFAISGVYKMPNDLESIFSVEVSRKGGKKFRRDSKPYNKMSEHIGTLPCVMVNPADIFLVSDAGEGRRRFVNSVISQMDNEYLVALQDYNRILSERNRALKAYYVDQDLLSVFDEKMSQKAEIIHKGRKAFCEKLNPMVKEYYKLLSGDMEEVHIKYSSDLDNGNLKDILATNRNKDLMCKFTGFGVHRDDFLFLMNGAPIRKIGSQGQQKSFLVVLKFAQYEIMKKNYGFSPILLLDDVFDKLDITRISNLLSLVAGNDFGQIFITDSNKIRMAGIVDKFTEDRAYFDTVDGVFHKLDS